MMISVTGGTSDRNFDLLGAVAFPAESSIKGDTFVLVVLGCHGNEFPNGVKAFPTLNLNLSIILTEN